MGCGAFAIPPVAAIQDQQRSRNHNTFDALDQQRPHNHNVVDAFVPASSSESVPGRSNSALSLNFVKLSEKSLPVGFWSSSRSEKGDFWRRSHQRQKRVVPCRSTGSTHSSSSCSSSSSLPDNGVPPISSESQQLLNEVLQTHFLFSALEEEERAAVIARMRPVPVESGRTIFTQGSRADYFFVIEAGTFRVSIDNSVIKEMRPKQTFGELALLYSVGRTGTVTCTQDGMLWSLGEKCFRTYMKKLIDKNFAKVSQFLRADPTFGSLRGDDLTMLAGACSTQTFQKGEQIVREGEVGDWMFIVTSGNVQTTDPCGNTCVKPPGTLLGSTGLMSTGRQIFGATAVDTVTCLALGRQSLERLFGPVGELLRRSAIKSLILDGPLGQPEDVAFFDNLFEPQQNTLADLCKDVQCTTSELVIHRGAVSQFIIVAEGEVAIITDQELAKAGTSIANIRAHARKILRAGTAYGGKALVGCLPMEECAVALTPARLHRIDHDSLSNALGDPLAEVMRLNEIKTVLLDVFLFKNLHEDQIDCTIRALERRTYARSDVIVRQGDEAKGFFLIQSGTIRVHKDGTTLRTLGRWDYFGERGLLRKEQRSATCQVDSRECSCFVLGGDVFADIVGMFIPELEHRMSLQDSTISMSDLVPKAVVGRGSFGIVKLVCHAVDASKVYALKCVSKLQVVQQHQQKALLVERDINAQCYHPCVVQFIKTLQDAANVYFLTEFLGGGDLFYAIREIGNLTKEQSQFYSGRVALALEYLHGRGIMYRDLKPENVLLDFKGVAKLVDFGCCKKAVRAITLVGTPEYLAPEAVLGKGYTCAVDWWALGVMMHEFIVGPLPFGRETDDQLELFREILEEPLELPDYVVDESAVAIIFGLLERSPQHRTACSVRGAKELQEHRYFNSFRWSSLVGHDMPSPWVPDTERLKANWETLPPKPLVDPDSPSEVAFDPTKVEPGMEWASVF